MENRNNFSTMIVTPAEAQDEIQPEPSRKKCITFIEGLRL
jgi:hypothetical protein